MVEGSGREVEKTRCDLNFAADQLVLAQDRYKHLPPILKNSIRLIRKEYIQKKFGELEGPFVEATKTFENAVGRLKLLKEETERLKSHMKFYTSGEDETYCLATIEGKWNKDHKLRIHRLSRFKPGEISLGPQMAEIVGFVDENLISEAESQRLYYRYWGILSENTSPAENGDIHDWNTEHDYLHPEEYFENVLSKPNYGIRKNPSE